MRRRGIVMPAIVVLSLVLASLTGCATLAVTPLQSPKAATAKMPVSIGVRTSAERLREVLANPAECTLFTASGQAFDKVVMLPAEAADKTPAEILAAYKTDYVLTTNLSDMNVSRSWNILFPITFPTLFFKYYIPFNTFEGTVTLANSLVDARTGAVIMQADSTASSTDHFSPKNSEDGTRQLFSRSINNALVGFLDGAREKMQAKGR